MKTSPVLESLQADDTAHDTFDKLMQVIIADQEALRAAEEFAVSMIPLLRAVAKVGSMEAALAILDPGPTSTGGAY